MPKKTLPQALKSWNAHVKAFRAKHPNLSFKECLRQAAKTYKKK